MPRWKTLVVLVFLIGLYEILGIVFIWKYARETAESPVATPYSDEVIGRSNKRLPRLVDPERRVEPLDDRSGNDIFDLSALVGMPAEYKNGLVEYTKAVLAEIGAVPLTRRRFYHKHRDDHEGEYAYRDPYPDDANPVYDRDVVVPLLILARPDVIHKWSASTEAQSLGWRTQNDVIKDRGSFYGRSLIFEPGELSVNPMCWPPSPFQTRIPSWDLYMPGYDDAFFLKLGKLVVAPLYHSGRGDGYGSKDEFLQDRSADLHLGEKNGAILLGDFVTVPAYIENTRLRWVSIDQGSNVHRFLAYSLLDGNGAMRERGRDLLASSRISPYVRPLICNQHQPRINQHDKLLLPTPLDWPPAYEDWAKLDVVGYAHEEWCLDDWFPAQKDACWVIRETAESKPLQESFLLMPASEASDRPIFFISLFAETEPAKLVQELSALYQVSSQAVLDSAEKMQRLQALYEKVRTFPLDSVE